MEEKQIAQMLLEQRAYFQSGVTLPLRFRLGMLKRLREAIDRWEGEIVRALKADLGKSDYESMMCEVRLARSEITYLLRHTARFARAHRVPTPLGQFAGRSYESLQPLGNVLIMSPWNYPFLLTIQPLADAIAAGNTAILKPSAYAPATGSVIEGLVKEVFSPEYVTVVTGGRQENASLLEQKFDLIFFTGSQTVGREVLRHAAENLIPTVLELGGKSPCIVDSTAKVELAARRIVFGKFLNCGQTCVAPDYILCHESVSDALVTALCREITRQYGETPLNNPDYGRIVNKKHFERLCKLMKGGNVVCGGAVSPETLQIAPTVLTEVTWNDPVMEEEIFGPILPVLTFRTMEDVWKMLANRPKPLALYLFSEEREQIQTVLERCQFGGGCVNDTVIHLATSAMGFGGVGESGMGAYHGKRGFDTFSHRKSIVEKKTWVDLPMRYQPYQRKRYQKLLRLFQR